MKVGNRIVKTKDIYLRMLLLFFLLSLKKIFYQHYWYNIHVLYRVYTVIAGQLFLQLKADTLTNCKPFSSMFNMAIIQLELLLEPPNATKLAIKLSQFLTTHTVKCIMHIYMQMYIDGYFLLQSALDSFTLHLM